MATLAIAFDQYPQMNWWARLMALYEKYRQSKIIRKQMEQDSANEVAYHHREME